MGSYLSQPVTTKESDSGAGGGFEWASSCMQGWRINMEDAHCAAADLELAPGGPKYSFYGVFDGHGGREVALFCQAHMPSVVHGNLETLLREKQALDVNTIAEALVRSFHAIDDMLRLPDYEEELLALRKPEQAAEGEGGTPKPPSGNPQVAHVQSRLQADIASVMARARDRGALSTQEAMRVAMSMSVLSRLEGATGATQPAPGAAANNVGCTSNCVAITDTHIVCANAGDSRAVLSRGGRAIALSRDHKPNDRVERRRIEAAGGTVKEVAANASGRVAIARTQYRVNGDLNLSRAIGDFRHKQRRDLRHEQQVVCSTPEVHAEAREEDDEFVVLACDGVWDVRTNTQVCDYVRRGIRDGKPLKVVIERLLDACISPDPKATQGLGGDNMTCVVVKFPGVDASTLAASGSAAGGLCFPCRCLR